MAEIFCRLASRVASGSEGTSLTGWISMSAASLLGRLERDETRETRREGETRERETHHGRGGDGRTRPASSSRREMHMQGPAAWPVEIRCLDGVRRGVRSRGTCTSTWDVGRHSRRVCGAEET